MAIAKFRLPYWRFERLHFLCLWVEPDDLHLRHVAVVNPPFLINIDLETALSDLAEPILRNGVLHDLAGFRIELSDKLRIKIRIPDVAFRIEHFVMGRCVSSRQIVGRVDHLRGFAFGPR